MHTAVKIEPVYRGPVVHVLDASRSVPVAQTLLDKTRQAGPATCAVACVLADQNTCATRHGHPGAAGQDQAGQQPPVQLRVCWLTRMLAAHSVGTQAPLDRTRQASSCPATSAYARVLPCLTAQRVHRLRAAGQDQAGQPLPSRLCTHRCAGLPERPARTAPLVAGPDEASLVCQRSRVRRTATLRGGVPCGLLCAVVSWADLPRPAQAA